jgi:hypothetical protein
MRLWEEFASVQKPHNCTLGSVTHGDYPANFSSARFVHFDPRRIFSGGDYFLALGCSEFSSYSAVGFMVRSFIRPHRLHASVLDRIGKMNCLEILELFRIQVMGVEFTVQS